MELIIFYVYNIFMYKLIIISLIYIFGFMFGYFITSLFVNEPQIARNSICPLTKQLYSILN